MSQETEETNGRFDLATLVQKGRIVIPFMLFISGVGAAMYGSWTVRAAFDLLTSRTWVAIPAIVY